MGTALSLSTNLKMGPVVAALGALAAGTLVAATILGQSLGPIPVDQPAIAMQPGEGVGQPLVIEVSGRPAPIDAGITGVLTTLAPAPSPVGAADDLFPEKSAAERNPTTTVIEEERVEPAPPTEDLLTHVQRRVAEIVRATSPAPILASVVDERIERPSQRTRSVQKDRTSKSATEGSTARTSSEPAPIGGSAAELVEVAAPVKQAADVVEDSLGKEEGTPVEVPQETSPTAAGPASPVL